MNWRIKGVLQKALDTFPGGELLNDAFQRTFGGLRDLDGTVDSKVVDDWVVLAEHLREIGRRTEGADFVEVGTGWFPVLPLCFALAGARSCHTFDVRRHLNVTLTTRAIARVQTHLPRIAQAADLDAGRVEQRYRTLRAQRSIDDAFRTLGLVYVAPGDAASTNLPSQSVDVVFSNSVLEHVPTEVIERIFVEARRILRPGGTLLHSVNCGDHYAYFDGSITAINYLRYTEKQWRRWNNGLQYQNRLRPIDFVEMARSAGFEVISQKFRPKEKLLAVLPGMRIAPEFRHYAPEQLCATSLDFAARPR